MKRAVPEKDLVPIMLAFCYILSIDNSIRDADLKVAFADYLVRIVSFGEPFQSVL